MHVHTAHSADELQRGLILRRTVLLAASAVLALDCTIATLWIAHAFIPGPVPAILFEVKFNGTLEFIAGAVGLLAALQGARWLVRACGTFMIAVGAANLVEFLTGHSLGIDELLMRDFFAALDPAPGRIFRNACLGFVCVGLGLLLEGEWKRFQGTRVRLVEGLGFAVFCLGASSMLGHLAPSPALEAAAMLMKIPLMAGGGLLLLSVGLMGLAGQKRGVRITLWFPAMACVLLLTMDLGTPRGLVAGIGYIPLIYCSRWFARPRMAFYFAAIGSVLGVAAFVLDTPGATMPWVSFSNRALTTCVLWIMAVLVYRQRTSELALGESARREAAIRREMDAGTALLASIVESSEDAIVSKELDGTILTWNRGAARILGYAPEEAVGRHIGMIIPTDLRAEEEKIIARLKAGEVVEHFETERLHKDGRRIALSMAVSPLRDAEGRIVGASKVARDITARKSLEAELRASELRNETALKGLSVGVWEFDPETLVTYWSPRLKQMLGLTEFAVASLEAIKARMHHDDKSRVLESLASHLEQRTPYDVEYRLRHEDGHYLWVHAVGQATWDADEKPLRMVGSVEDISARKTAELELRESRMRYKAVIDCTPDGLFTTGCTGCIQSFNLSAERIFGYSSDEMMGREAAILIDEEFLLDRDRLIPEELKSGEARMVGVGREVSGRRKDGSQLPLDLTVSAFRIGAESGFAGIVRDITARKLVENNGDILSASIVASSDDGIISKSLSGFITSWNQGAERMFGFKAREAIGQHIRIIIPAEKLEEEDSILERVNRGEGVQHYETQRMAQDGMRIDVSLTVSPVRDMTGSLIGASTIMRDITQRKRQEAERLRMENRLRAVVDNAVDGLITIDVRGNVESFNPACVRIFGYESADVLGRNIKMLMPEPYQSEHDGYLSRFAATGEARIIGTAGREVMGRREDGGVFPMDLSVSAFELGDGRHYSGIVRDISLRKRDEAERERTMIELSRHTQALERSNRELDAFAYAASHDLKAPLRVIHNASMWIEEDLAAHLTAETRENMNLLRSRVSRMERLLDDLLRYSRIGREKAAGQHEALSGKALMEDILELLAPPAGFAVEVCPAMEGIEVYRMPLQQVLLNLISNAIKHHDKKAGRIEVCVEDLGAMFRFRVKDDGPGIAPQYHKQIFEMFQTLKPRDQVEGSGMGLAMVQKHIDVAGGELSLESAVGQGSTFIFTWPKNGLHNQQVSHLMEPLADPA